MKKHIVKRAAVLSVAGIMAVTAFTGCGSKDKEKNASARKVIEYNINDYVTLGQYTGLDVDEKITAVTDADIEAQLEALISSATTYEEVTDRHVIEGDRVTVDYTRSVEGEEDTSQVDLEFVIGDAYLSEEFDEHLLDLELGSTITFTIQESETDSETGETKDIDATYTVTLNTIEEPVVPELTDEFIADNSDYDTIEGYREGTRAQMEETNAENAKSATQAELLNMVIDSSEVSGCPPFIYNMNYNSILQSYALYGSYFGADMETYMSYSGVTLDDIKNQAVEMTMQTLVIEAIVKAAGIDITDEQFDEEVNRYVEEYDAYNSAEDVLKAFTHEELLFDMRRDVAIDYIYENNNINKVTVSGDGE